MTESLVGRTLAHYRITHRLGSGGMGVVYAARDLRLDRAVAVKILTTPDRTGRDLLLHEARAASAVTHPHVAAIHALGLRFLNVRTHPRYQAALRRIAAPPPSQ